MALCAPAAACGCALTSESLSISGTGSILDPYVVDTGPLDSVGTYAGLSNPAAMEDGAAFFVEEANELAVVKDGLYFVPGQKFYELAGSLSPGSPIGVTTTDLVVTAVFPPAPVTFSGGAVLMRSYFHPAELTVYSIRPFDKTESFRPDSIEVIVGGSSNTYLLTTEAERWGDDPDTLDTISIGRGQNPAGAEEVNNPILSSTSPGTAFMYNVRSFGEAMAAPSYITIGLNWTVFE